MRKKSETVLYEKKLYMKKQISILLMVEYLFALLVLLCASFYLLRDLSVRKVEREQELFDSYVDSVERGITESKRVLQNIYTFNDNFELLTFPIGVVDQYAQSTTLLDTLETYIYQYDYIDGFYLYFGNNARGRYFCAPGKLTPTQQHELYEYLFLTVSGDNNGGSRLVRIGDKLLMLNVVKRGCASLYAIHDYSDLETELSNALSENMRDISTILEENEIYYYGEELAEKYFEGTLPDITVSYMKETPTHRTYGRRLKNTDLRILALVHKNWLEILSLGQLFLLILAVLLGVGAYLLGQYIKNGIYEPLNQLIAIMNKIRRGELHEISNVRRRYYELSEVYETMDQMICELEAQKLAVYEETISKQKTQLMYHQLQLRPHFYINGLKTLDSLIANGRNDSAREFVSNLSTHMRYLLNNGMIRVPLLTELKFVENYVAMQTHMTGRKIEMEFHIEEDVKDFWVPTFCIETFVENSIKYSKLGNSHMLLLINVDCHLLTTENGSFIDLIIFDNGCGYNAEVLREINSNKADGELGVGIKNIKNRCVIIYDNQAEFNFYNANGAVSELILPKESKYEDTGC